jgi:YbbR domain-containing protein
VRVRGPERIIHQLRLTDLHLEIDLSAVKPGERTFDLTSHEVQHPASGLEVVQVIPSQLHIAFDERLTRKVEVHPRVIGSFATGYQISRILVEPPFVTITGPRKRVEAVDVAITDPIDASGVLDQANFVRHAYVSDPLVQVLNSDPVHIAVIMEKSAGGR